MYCAASIGTALDLLTPRQGTVHSIFDRAINMIVDCELWTLANAEYYDGPFAIRLLPGDNVRASAAKVGDAVHVRAGYIAISTFALDCRSARRWQPGPWLDLSPNLARDLERVERIVSSCASFEAPAIASDVIDALESKSTARLAITARHSVGYGPGLTPAGDDVLAGVLSVLTASAAGSRGAAAKAHLCAALTPLLHRTTDISRHFLTQAMRGLTPRPVHVMGKCLLEGAPQQELTDAVVALLQVGHSSGADACMGMLAAMHYVFLDQRAAH